MRWLIFSKQVFKRLRDVSLWQSLQTVSISLLLVMMLFPYPSNFISYVMGFCLGFALVHRLLLPPQKGADLVFRYALPYLVLYGVLLISCFFFGNVPASLSFCGRYLCLWLIPLVFVGMTSSFFTARRLRIFAVCLVVGVVIGVLWKVFVLYQICFYNRLDVYREQGLRIFIKYTYEYFRVFQKDIGYAWEHPAFEALFNLIAFVVVLWAWIKRDAFFSHGYSKILAVFAIGIITVNLLFFCTKTAALGGVCSAFALWVYAFCKKRYVFVGASAVGVLLCMGFLIRHPPETVFARFYNTVQMSRDFLTGKSLAQDASFVPRIHTYKIGWDMFMEKPLTGRGVFYGEEFGQRYKGYLDQVPGLHDWEKKILTHSHNQLLMVLDVCGIVGGMVLVWLFVCILRDVWRRNSLFWWIWFAGLLAICAIDVIFNRTVGFIYLCGFHGILFCELASDSSRLEV